MSATSWAWGQLQTWMLLVDTLESKNLDYHTRDYQTKWIKPDRKANIIWYHLYVESKKITQNVFNKTETDSQTQKTNLRLPKGKRVGER